MIIKYSLMGFVVFWAAMIISMFVADAIGPGAYDIGVVITSLALLIATIAVCTMVIVDAIKGIKIDK